MERIDDFKAEIMMQPKMSVNQAAQFIGVSVQALHRQLKTKNLVCPKIGNKSYITHSIAKELFNIQFKKRLVTCQIVKGGTGKTTTVHNIASACNVYGAKVCLIDIDPQGNLSDACGVDADDYPALIDLVSDDSVKIEDCIVPVCDGLDIMPSRIENVVLDNKLMLEKHPIEGFFRDLLDPVIEHYDFIIIDCPPTMGWTVSAAALAADEILVPLNPEKFSAKGLRILKQEVNTLEKRYKREISYKVFLNKFSGNTILSDKAITTIISDPDLEGKVLQTAVRFGQEVPNTTDSNRNLFSSLKKSTARDDFDLLTRELFEIRSPREETATTSEQGAVTSAEVI